MKERQSLLLGIRPHETSEGSRAPSNLSSESLTPSQIRDGRIQDLERRVAMLEKDYEIISVMATSIQNDVTYLKKRVKEVLNIDEEG